MKKFLASLMVLTMAISLSACKNEIPSAQTDPTISQEQIDAMQPEMSDVIAVEEYEDVIDTKIVLDTFTKNVRITAEGEYTVTGSMTDKMIFVDSPGYIVLNFENVSIENSTGPCIYVKNEGVLHIVLASESTNSIISTGNDAYKALNAAVYSHSDVVLDGAGKLVIKCSHAHAVKSTNMIGLLAGSYTVESLKNCFDAHNLIHVEEGAFDLKSIEGDGIAAEDEVVIQNGQFNINAASDGIKSDVYVEIHKGTFNIESAGEGIESKKDMIINGGDFTITTVDDCINAIGKLTINGGTILATSLTNDAIDGNEGIEINGGNIYAVGVAEREGAFDCDDSELRINGGSIIGIGETNSDWIVGDQQGVIINTKSTEAIKFVELKDVDGNVVYSCEIKPYETTTNKESADQNTLETDNGKLPSGSTPGQGNRNESESNNNVVVGQDSMLYVSILISDESIINGTYDIYLNGTFFEKVSL